jgi:hypothetical protein
MYDGINLITIRSAIPSINFPRIQVWVMFEIESKLSKSVKNLTVRHSIDSRSIKLCLFRTMQLVIMTHNRFEEDLVRLTKSPK